VKPPTFTYEDPRTLDAALALLAEHQDDATLLAGGQSLVPLLNMRLSRPEVVVDLNRVDGLDRISISDDAVVLGATVRLKTVETDPGVRAAIPVLSEAVSYVAHPQIRARSTIGGTLCHADPTAEVPLWPSPWGPGFGCGPRRESASCPPRSSSSRCSSPPSALTSCWSRWSSRAGRR
jgi:carbon-monoxide dehydrogenase medium subunit